MLLDTRGIIKWKPSIESPTESSTEPPTRTCCRRCTVFFAAFYFSDYCQFTHTSFSRKSCLGCHCILKALKRRMPVKQHGPKSEILSKEMLEIIWECLVFPAISKYNCVASNISRNRNYALGKPAGQSRWRNAFDANWFSSERPFITNVSLWRY